MSSKRLSLRFNLNNPGDLAAWEYLHRLDGDSINKEIISMINASKQNNDLRELLRQTITVAMQGMALQRRSPVNAGIGTKTCWHILISMTEERS